MAHLLDFCFILRQGLYVSQARLEPRTFSVLSVLRLKVCTTKPSYTDFSFLLLCETGYHVFLARWEPAMQVKLALNS